MTYTQEQYQELLQAYRESKTLNIDMLKRLNERLEEVMFEKNQEKQSSMLFAIISELKELVK